MAFGPGALNPVIEEIRQYGIHCIGLSQRRHVAAFGHFDQLPVRKLTAQKIDHFGEHPAGVGRAHQQRARRDAGEIRRVYRLGRRIPLGCLAKPFHVGMQRAAADIVIVPSPVQAVVCP